VTYLHLVALIVVVLAVLAVELARREGCPLSRTVE